MGRRELLSALGVAAISGLPAACRSHNQPTPATTTQSSMSPSASLTPQPWVDAVMRGQGGSCRVITADFSASGGQSVLEGKLLGPVFNRAGSKYTFSVDYSTWGKLADRIMTSAAGNALADLIMPSVGWVAPLAQRGLISELPVALTEGLGVPDQLLAPCRWGGKLYALPQGVNLRVVAYRADLASSAGITAMPTTLDELRGVAKSLTASGRVGIDLFSTPIQQTWVQLVASYGGTMFKPNGVDMGFVDGSGVKALDFIVNLVKDGSADPGVMAAAGQPRPFNQGKAAIDIVDSSMWGGLQSANLTDPTKLGLGLLPGAAAGNDPVILVEGALLAAKPGPNLEVSEQVIASMLQTQALVDAATFTGRTPVRAAAAAAEVFKPNRIMTYGLENIDKAIVSDGGSACWLGLVPGIEGEIMAAIKHQQSTSMAVDNISKLASTILSTLH